MNITDFSGIPTIQNLVCAVPQAGVRCDPSRFEDDGIVYSSIKNVGTAPVHSFIQEVDWYARKGFQTDYSVRDAAASLFKREHGTISLSDPQSLNNHVQWMRDRYKAEGTLSINPTQRELDAYLDKLRQEGLDGKVDWSGLSREFEAFQSTAPEELSDGIGYLASRYAAVLDKLERNYSGADLEMQKAKLEEVYRTGADGLTEGYAKLLGENLGMSGGDVQDIKDSLNAALAQRVEDYRGAMAQVNAGAANAGADAVWLKNCDAYLAAQLRKTGAGTEGAGAAYSVEDLAAAGQIATLYRSEADSAAAGNRDEAKLALNLAMADMKAEKLISSGKVGGRMAELLQGSRGRAHANVLDAAGRYLAKREANRSEYVPAGTFAPMDRGMFGRIYSAVMDSYRRTGNAAGAIRAGAAVGERLTGAAGRKNPQVLRWGSGMKAYWQNFYTTPQRRDDPLHRQISQMLQQANLPDKSVNSTYQNYVNDWQGFLASAGGGTAGVDIMA